MPFLALRSYLPADHPDKGKEIGSEATPAEFIDTLLALTAEWRRLLAPHGSICVELGDTYAGSGGAGGDYNVDGLRAGQPKFKQRTDGGRYANGYSGNRAGNDVSGSNPAFDVRPVRGKAGWPLDKSLTGIPTLYAWSLAYGRNLLTGQESPAGQWRIRNLVAWVRPNPPVGALADKFRPATSYLTVATLARDRYFDLDAVRGAHSPNTHARPSAANGRKNTPSGNNLGPYTEHINPAGAPPLDWWEIPPGGYSGSHYAVYPTELCEKPIEAMCPRRVCTVCGRPSRRVVGEAEYHQSPNAHSSGRAPDDVAARTWESGIAKGKNQSADLRDGGVIRVAPTLGWSDCGCPGENRWRPGLVLDPFAGSGTTLVVGHGHGRDALGIDLDERNADLARQRLGMFLDVDVPPREVPA